MRATTAARRVAPVVVALTLVILLAGCVKLDVDLHVATNDTVSGTMVVAVDNNVLEGANVEPDALYTALAGSLTGANLPEGASVTPEKYDQDGYSGIQLTLKDVPIADLPDLSGRAPTPGASSLRLTRDGDVYHFDAVLDVGPGAVTGVSIPEGLTGQADLSVAVTFPGQVTATNGTKDGSTARWTPTLGQSTELTATAGATGSSGSGGSSAANGLLVLAAVIGGVAVLGAVSALWLARRRVLGHSIPLTPVPSETQAPPPPLSSLQPPARPLPPPLPPPEQPR
jgi:hypothetical protein